MHATRQQQEELKELIAEVKMQDQAFYNVKLKLDMRLASLEIRKAIKLFEASPDQLKHYASIADLKGMRGIVGARQGLIDFVIRKAIHVV